jgi:anti-anti-sigma factor
MRKVATTLPGGKEVLRLIRKRSVPASVVVVRLPAEIDSSNAEQVRQQLCGAFTPAVRIVVADLTGTTFCDVAGVRGLARARAFLAAGHAELRLAVRPGPVRRVLVMLSPGGPFLLYASSGEAMRLGKLSPGSAASC